MAKYTTTVLSCLRQTGKNKKRDHKISNNPPPIELTKEVNETLILYTS